jgi:hypothetical protein
MGFPHFKEEKIHCRLKKVYHLIMFRVVTL